jgi:hypothetical protein
MSFKEFDSVRTEFIGGQGDLISYLRFGNVKFSECFLYDEDFTPLDPEDFNGYDLTIDCDDFDDQNESCRLHILLEKTERVLVKKSANLYQNNTITTSGFLKLSKETLQKMQQMYARFSDL